MNSVLFYVIPLVRNSRIRSNMLTILSNLIAPSTNENKVQRRLSAEYKKILKSVSIEN